MNLPPDDLRISVIILTVNQREQTLRCLKSLRKDRSHLLNVNVTVWDNGSEDGTAAAIRDADSAITVLISETNLGVAAGRNAAAKAVIAKESPDFLLFLDNDMTISPGFIGALAAPFYGENGLAIGQTQAKLRLSDDPECLNDGGGCRIRFWLGQTRPVGFGEQDRGQYDTPAPCQACCGGAMMVRTDLFVELGGFDETFNPFGPEDLDFSLRLQERGYEAWYIPAAMAFHDVNHTVGAGFSEDYAALRSRHWLRLMRRHASVLDWIGFVVIGMPSIALRVLFREGRKRNFGALRGLIRGVFSRRG